MSASRIERAVAFAMAVAASACRLGGPSGDPSFLTEGGVTDASSADSPSSDAAAQDADGGQLASSTDDSAYDGADEGTDGSPGPADVSAEAAPAVDAVAMANDGGCRPAFISTVCDPVCNTNCPGLQRCDVSNTARAGVCIGIWISAEGASCLSTATTDPCAPMLTCFTGTCRRLCYADSDCTTTGTCCNTSIDLGGGPSGFRVCSSCGP
jgi:hypothetical protein